MRALLFIIIITSISVFISKKIINNDTWFEVYVGTLVGFLISGIVLSILNKIKRKKELEVAKSNINPLYKKKDI